MRALLVLLISVPLAAGDYLTPELRYQVDRLKEEARLAPTHDANVEARADVLWAWANAYSLSGKPIPQDLPVIIRSARWSPTQRAFDLIDFYIYELTLKDETPNAVPTVTQAHSRPVEVRSWQSFEQTITIGSKPMARGGRILVGKDGFNDPGTLQTEDPGGDNYLSIRSSNPRARFEAGGPSSGVSLPSRVRASFTLQGTRLTEGETITLTYGDRSGGGRGLLMQTYTVDEHLLPVYIDLEKKLHGITPIWTGVELIGKPEVARVVAIGPSVVRPGEGFELAIRSDDAYYNRASGNIPAYEISLNGEPFRTTPKGSNGLQVLSNLKINQEGVYRFEVRSAEGKLETLSNPIWVRQNPPYRIWYGDTHAHTRFAEGQGRPNGFYLFARDDARLDFVTLSEHDIWLDDAEWARMRELADRYHEPGVFIPVLGYEWTWNRSNGGHHNVLFRDTKRTRIGGQVTETLSRLYRVLKLRNRTNDVMTIPHAHQPGDWTNSDRRLERLVEIASVHGTFEFFGNRYLQNGWQVGFIGSTDNHHSHPGYTDTGTTFHTERNGLAAVMSTEKTYDSIFSAMRNIRAYATSGDRIILDATMDGRPVGTRLREDAPRRINVRAMGTAPIDTIDVIKNGAVVYSRSFARADLSSTTRVQVAFSSTSEVYSHRPPREYRTWEGTFEVAGATIVGLENASFDNQHMEWVRREGRRVEFRALTRGRSDVLLLDLEGASESTAVRFDIKPSRISRGRGEYEQIPAERFELKLGERRLIELPSLDAGEVNEDSVSLEILDPDASLDQMLEFEDREEGNPGDYYYVRVTQIDGERAWSSPFWVGGEARR